MGEANTRGFGVGAPCCKSGQINQALGVEGAQRLQTAGLLHTAPRIKKPERLTHKSGRRIPAQVAPLAEQRGYFWHRSPKRRQYLMLCLHAGKLTSRIRNVKYSLQ